MKNKAALAFLGAAILVLALMATRKTCLRAEPEDSSPKSAACRFVLASLHGNAPIDEDIAQQQTLIRNGSNNSQSPLSPYR